MTLSADATIVVELTPAGRGAVAVVLIDGPKAIDALRSLFKPATPWKTDGPPIDRIMFGRWRDESGEEVVVCRRGTAQFEIHCHGGVAAVGAIIDQLLAYGGRRLGWQEWLASSRAQVDAENCQLENDSIKVAARIALADAPTSRTAAILLDQYHGALSKAIEAARAAVVSPNFDRASAIVDDILQFEGLGLHLTRPWQVVIAGPPNVGKSSLINAIAGYQRAIVSPVPGTTRDVVTLTTAINGWPVLLADTAGIREAADELERAGVALAELAASQADLVVAVADATAPDGAWQNLWSGLASPLRTIRVVNKIDLVPPQEASDGVATPASSHCEVSAIKVSALTGQGVPALIAAIERTLVPVEPPTGSAVAFTAEQFENLRAARAAIAKSDAAEAVAAFSAM